MMEQMGAVPFFSGENLLRTEYESGYPNGITRIQDCTGKKDIDPSCLGLFLRNPFVAPRHFTMVSLRVRVPLSDLSR